jgi:DNA (cytosine-5)-methyltransferase 1
MMRGRKMENVFTTIDLFAGAGGLSEGFHQEGFHILVANDHDPVASETFRLNFPESVFIPGDIEEIASAQFLQAGNLRKGELCALAGGPPCQAFSVYNHQRGMHDERSGLFREYLRIVADLMPAFVVMENVTGMQSIDEGRAIEEIHRQLKKLGYYVEHRVLCAEKYGIPQERRRIFFIGSRDLTSIQWPAPTHRSAQETNNNNKPYRHPDLFTAIEEARLKPYVTVWDAISDLPALGIREGEEDAAYSMPAQSRYQRMLRRGSRRLYNHVAPDLSDINLQRLKHIPQGGSWRDIPYDLLPAGMQRAKRSDHTKRYGRLHPDGLCCTILTKCDLHWGSYIHPTQERTLTVREAARFQSFPDRIRFIGSRGDQYRQVGNAVPPLLGRAVAAQIKKMLESSGIIARPEQVCHASTRRQ